MPLSAKEQMQIRDVVDKVVEARLMQFSELQLALISEMLLNMTDKYVESLMKLARVIGLPEAAANEEASRMAKLMMEQIRK